MKEFLLYKHVLVSFNVFITLLITTPVFCQVSLQWARFYDSPTNSQDGGIAIVADDFGNAYVTGVGFGTNTHSDYVTIKYNSLGSEQWVIRYDGFNREDVPVAIAIDKSGNIYVTGFSEGNGTSTDIVTIKYSNMGVQQWIARFNGPANGSDYVSAIKIDESGNVYVAGSAEVTSSNPDYTTIKYNAQGVLQWVQYYNGSGNGVDLASAIALDPVTFDVYVTGVTAASNSGEDFTTLKYNQDGVQQWDKTYNSPTNEDDEAKAIALDPQGNICVTGIIIGAGNLSKAVTIKYDPSGAVKWIAPYNGENTSITVTESNAIAIDKFSNIYITGLTAEYDSYCATVKYNSEGVEEWVRLYNGPGDARYNRGNAISLDSDGNIYVAGAGSGAGTSVDYLTLKYNPEGVEKWARLYDAFTNYDVATAIAIDKFNNVFVTGSVRRFTGTNAGNNDYGTIKYTQSQPLTVAASPDTTIYYGYGSNCVQLKAEVSGGTAPYSFSWSPGGTTPNDQITTVCPTSTSVYTVTVTDADGNKATTQVTVALIDVRCDDKKVVVCHNGKELCIAASAVRAHLQHGDKPGSCSLNINGTYTIKEAPEWNGKLALFFKAYPNPTSNLSTIIYQVPVDAQVTITLTDLNGRELRAIVQQRKRAGYYVTSVNTNKLVPGVYLCRMTISSSPYPSVHTLKLIVVK